MKADQIYALYDVLEGQKESGQMMTMDEEGLEMTLQSIGLDINELGLGGVGDDTNARDDDPTREFQDVHAQRPVELEEDSDLSDDDEEDELPWEGVEETVESTKGQNQLQRSAVQSRPMSVLA